MQWIDQKYLGILSNRLPLFRKRGSVYNCRCPLCGDSKTNKLKARGYFLLTKGSYIFYCHNCNAALPLRSFLEQVDKELAGQYIQDVYLETNNNTSKKLPVKQPTIEQFSWPRYLLNSPLKELKKISQLRVDHPAKKYVEKRKLPVQSHSFLFYAPNFNKWVNSFIPNKLPEKKEPRLVIPFIDKKNNLIGFTGRSFGTSEPRYITIMLGEDALKIFGLDRANLTKRTYITEGPIDSLFLSNALALGGSGFLQLASKLGLDNDEVYRKNIVLVYDNEPRNKDIVKLMSKALNKGWSVCIWPDNLHEKDINEMVLSGKTSWEIEKLIDQHTYSGLQGITRLNEWKRV